MANPAFAGGGPVGGGRGGVDDIHAMLTRGEYVMPKEAVDHYGTGFLDQIRNRQMRGRGYAAGGPVPGPVSGSPTAGSGDTYNITITVDSAKGTAKSTSSTDANSKDGADKAKGLAKLIEEGARKVIVQEKRPGGLLNAK